MTHHSLLFFPQPLSVNKPCRHYRAGEYGLKRDVFHLSTAIMLPIRRDIFISSGRDVRPDWADSCALMERDNRLSGVRSHSRYPAIHFHQACQEADGIFSIGLPHIICSKYESCHQNVTARIKKGEQAGDWVVARTHFWKSPDNKRRPTFLLSNFSSCEIHCWPRSVILPHYMHLSSIWAFEDLEQMHLINLCWCKLKQSQCTAVARPTRIPN